VKVGLVPGSVLLTPQGNPGQDLRQNTDLFYKTIRIRQCAFKVAHATRFPVRMSVQLDQSSALSWISRSVSLFFSPLPGNLISAALRTGRIGSHQIKGGQHILRTIEGSFSHSRPLQETAAPSGTTSHMSLRGQVDVQGPPVSGSYRPDEPSITSNSSSEKVTAGVPSRNLSFAYASLEVIAVFLPKRIPDTEDPCDPLHPPGDLKIDCCAKVGT
jgi:hypothetical protein